MLDGNEAMTEHIHTSLAVLQHEITNQGLVLAIFGSHLNKCYFVMNGTETFDLNTHGTADYSFDCFLRCSLHFGHGLQISKSITPRHRKHHERRARIDQCVASHALGYVRGIIDSYGSNNSTYFFGPLNPTDIRILYSL